MTYESHPAALEEYNAAGLYYAQKEPGLDSRFIVAVESALKAITKDPCRFESLMEMSADA
jgi:hypothetical protein